MKDLEKIENSILSSTYTVLTSEKRVIVLPPLNGIEIHLIALNIKKEGFTKTDFKLIESNEKVVFHNLNTNVFVGFDIDELNLGKIRFQYENGLYETFDMKEIEPTNDLQQYLQ